MIWKLALSATMPAWEPVILALGFRYSWFIANAWLTSMPPAAGSTV